jgi:hypothetical protein
MGGGDLDFLVAIFGILVVLVPIIGLTTILTLRFGGKPFVETLARELRDAGAFGPARTNDRLIDLSERIETLSDEVRQLREAQAFDKTLLERPRGASVREQG